MLQSSRPAERHVVGPVASLSQVSKRRGGRTILADMSLAVRAGEVTALLGPNGAGKSTLVGLITGHLDTDAGQALLFGLPPRALAARARMGVMMQSAGLPEQLTVAETLAQFAGYYPRARPVAELLAVAGLTDLARRRCDALSGGQARRVQFACAIAGVPDLLVLDEPTTGMDGDARHTLWATVRSAADAGAAVLLTTHHLDEADALADRILVISDGRIVADAAPAEVKAAAAGSTIRCRSGLADAQIAALPGVRGVHRQGADAVVRSADAVATTRALLSADSMLADLSIAAASLDEAVADLIATGAMPEPA